MLSVADHGKNKFLPFKATLKRGASYILAHPFLLVFLPRKAKKYKQSPQGMCLSHKGIAGRKLSQPWIITHLLKLISSTYEASKCTS